MVTPTCPQCSRPIPRDDVNVAADVAYCRACHLSHALSELTHEMYLTVDLDLGHPPTGAWYRNEGGETIVGASHRSLVGALGALAVSLFWNGITSLFVFVAISGTLANLDITAPHWFPAPNMNGKPMSVGAVTFLWIFLTPFIGIGIGMIGAFLSCLCGRTEVRIFPGQGAIFVGLGPLGYTRRFESSKVKHIRIEDQYSSRNGQSKICIVIETAAGKVIKFGSMLREDRRKFLAGALRKSLACPPAHS